MKSLLVGGRDEVGTRDIVFRYRGEIIRKNIGGLSGCFLSGYEYTHEEAMGKLREAGYSPEDAREFLESLPKVKFPDFFIDISFGVPEEVANSEEYLDSVLEVKKQPHGLCFWRRS